MDVCVLERGIPEDPRVGYAVQGASTGKNQIFVRCLVVQPVEQLDGGILEMHLTGCCNVHLTLRDLIRVVSWWTQSLDQLLAVKRRHEELTFVLR